MKERYYDGCSEHDPAQEPMPVVSNIISRVHDNALTTALLMLQLEEYMYREDIGFNKLAKILSISASQLSKLCQCKANITLATFSHVLRYT